MVGKVSFLMQLDGYSNPPEPGGKKAVHPVTVRPAPETAPLREESGELRKEFP